MKINASIPSLRDVDHHAHPDTVMIFLGICLILGTVWRGISAGNHLLLAGALLLCVGLAWRTDLYDGVSYYGGPPQRLVKGAVAQRVLFLLAAGALLFTLVKGYFPFV